MSPPPCFAPGLLYPQALYVRRKVRYSQADLFRPSDWASVSGSTTLAFYETISSFSGPTCRGSHGFERLARLHYLWPDFRSCAALSRGAGRASELSPSPPGIILTAG